MHNGSLRIFFWIARLLIWLSAGSLVIVAALLRAEPEEVSLWSELLGRALLWVQAKAWLALIVLFVANRGFSHVARCIKRQVDRADIRSLLETTAIHAFGHVEGDPPYHHRVTLFKAVKSLRYRRSLVAYERSCHVTRRGVPSFPISDKPEMCQGIAGWTWANRQVIHVNGLPALTLDSPPDQIVDYAKATHVDESWIRHRLAGEKPLRRSYLGIPIEVDGEAWGVVVLDSMGERTIRTTKALMAYYRLMGLALGCLLSRRSL